MSRVTSYLRPTNNNVNTLNIGSGSNQWNNVYVEYNSSFRLRNGSSNRVYVSGSGNVGINTTNPQQKLDVAGKIYSNNYIVAGVGSGGVGLTHNDGYGNANVTFNHLAGVPEQNGQSGRIEVNTDNTTTVGEMFFELSSAPVTSGTAVGLSTALKLSPNHLDIPYRVRHLGDTDTYMQFDTDRVRLAAGGTTFLDSNTPPVSNSGTGIAGYVAKYTGASTIDDGIIYDSGTAIGIGTANPSSKLHVEGSGVAIANGTNTKTTLIPSGGGNSELTLKGQNYNHYVNYETSWNSFRSARLKSSYNTSDSEFYLYKSNGTGGTAATTTISTGNSNFSGKVGIGNPSPSAFLDIDNIGNSVTAISVSAGTNEQFSVRTDGTNNGSLHVKGNDAVTRAYLAGAASGSSYIINQLGIGTTNPTSDLHISDSFPRITLQDSDGTNTLSYIDQDGSYLNLIARNGTNNGNIRFRRYNGTTTTNSMIINSSGKVGVGTTNPHGLLSSQQGQQTGNVFTNPNLALQSSTAADGGFCGMTFAASSAINYGYSVGAHRTSGAHSDFEINYHYNDAAGTTRFMVDQTGNIGIGTTNPSAHLHVEGSAQGAKLVSTQSVGIEVQGGGNSADIAIFRDTSGNEEFSIDTSGALFSLGMASSSSANANLMHNPTTGQIYRYTSSIRYKEDVTDLENAVDKIKELRPVNFKSKDTGEYNTGMIAEEVAEVMPEITYKADVEGFDTPQVDGITYEPLHAYYIKAIQELSSKIEQLESRIQTLENN